MSDVLLVLTLLQYDDDDEDESVYQLETALSDRLPHCRDCTLAYIQLLRSSLQELVETDIFDPDTVTFLRAHIARHDMKRIIQSLEKDNCSKPAAKLSSGSGEGNAMMDWDDDDYEWEWSGSNHGAAHTLPPQELNIITEILVLYFPSMYPYHHHPHYWLLCSIALNYFVMVSLMRHCAQFCWLDEIYSLMRCVCANTTLTQ